MKNQIKAYRLLYSCSFVDKAFDVFCACRMGIIASLSAGYTLRLACREWLSYGGASPMIEV